MITKEQLGMLTGTAVLDSAGMECGTCTDVYVDDRTDTPAWAMVTTEDGTACCAPLDGASMEGDTLRVACTMQQMVAAPSIAGNDEIDPSTEHRLREHYGLAGSAGAGAAGGMGAETAVAPGSVIDEATGDFATGMRGEAPGTRAGEEPAGAPTQMQRQWPGDHGEHEDDRDDGGTHLRSWSSMG